MRPALNGIFYKDFASSYIPHILKEIYIDRIYDPYLENIKDGVCLDVGGNIGMWSQFAAPLAKQIYTLEPSAEHLQTIRHMLDYNKIESVEPLQIALSHENGSVDLFHSQNVTAHSLYHGMDNAGTSEKVEAVTLDTLVDRLKIKRINFMKLDPEGAEFAILGSEGFKKVAPIIDALVVELHAWPGISYNQAVASLRDNGFEVTRIPSEAFILGAKKK